METNTLVTNDEITTMDIKKPIASPPLLNKMMVLFMGAMVLANISGFMYGPLLPLYLTSLNASVVQVGIFFTLSKIIPLALQILGGWMSDNLGRLRSIAMGSVAGAVSFVGLILAPTWHWVLLGEGLGSICRSLVAPSYPAFIAEHSTEENRARVYGITETVFMVVNVIGPPLGGWLVDNYGFRFMLVVAAALYLVATFIRIGMARTAARSTEANPQRLSMESLRTNLGTMFGLLAAGGLVTWILVTDGVRDIAYEMSFTLTPLYLNDIGKMSVQQIGWMESVFGIFMMITTTPAGWLADKKGERLGILTGFVLQFASLLLFTHVTTLWGFMASWALLGVSVGLMSPAYNSLISKAVPEKVRGTAMGLFQSSLGFVSLPAPMIGAQLWDKVNPQFPFNLTAWVALLITLPIWKKFKLPANGNNHQSEEK
ncbi:MAG: MFS transporter [Anaerolineales bacterium]|nr:MFS transporter [Anaerolineales bacterium]